MHVLKCLTGLEPKFTKATMTKSLSLNFAPLPNIHFNTFYIHNFLYNYGKKCCALIQYLWVCACAHACVCILFKMLSVLPEVNIFLLIRSSTCYLTPKDFLLEFSHQKECTGMNPTTALARHYTAPQPLRDQNDTSQPCSESCAGLLTWYSGFSTCT